MAYEIFWGAGSPYSWRTLLALEVKGLDYTSRLLEFSKNEHRSEKMLAMNPRGLLPVLKDGDISVHESIAIIAYLDRQHPDVPLFGTNAKETGFIWQRVFELENHLSQYIIKIVIPVFFDDVTDNIDAMQKAGKYVQAEFKILETFLNNNSYLAGATISAADIVTFPPIQALSRAIKLMKDTPPDLDFISIEKHFPTIAQWIQRIEALPGYERTYPPNWEN